MKFILIKLQSDRYTTGERALTREEYEKLVKVITDLQDELMIRLGVAQGFGGKICVTLSVTTLT